MAHWIPPPTGFQGHLLNPCPGHRMETVHQNGVPVGHASVFREFPCGNTRHIFMVKEFAKLTPNPYVQKFDIPLLRKTLVSKIDQKNDPLYMYPDKRSSHSTILMSWIQRSWRFLNPSNDHHSMAHWSPPHRGFQGHLLNPYPGHRVEIMHKNWITMGDASVFRHVPCGNSSHMFMVEEFAKLTPMCKNFAFSYWAKP